MIYNLWNFLFTLLEWCLVLPSFSCLSLPVLLDHCNLVSWCFCLFVHFLCTGLCVFNKIFMLSIKKKKRCIKCYGNWRDYYRCYTILLPHISTFIDVLLNQSSELLVGDKWTSRQQIDLIFSLCLFIGDVCTGWTSIPWWTSAP